MMHQSLLLTASLAALLVTSGANIVRRQTDDILDKISKLPHIDTCGPIGLTFGQKVIDGEPAELGEFPWMALLGYTSSSESGVRWMCGGTLITDRYVITAAHCVVFSNQLSSTSYTLVTVRLGELDYDDSIKDFAEPEDFGVDKIIPHEDYDNRRKINDISLVRLDRTVTFSKLVKPICLPPDELYRKGFVGENTTVAGWGVSQPNSSHKTDSRLLKADVVIKDTDECRRNYTSSNRNVVIDHRVMCASAQGKDACQGDSGGPLMYKAKTKNVSGNNKGNYFIMGVISYGRGCAEEGFPGVYTKVSEFMAWIVNNLQFDD